jgi:hypothetical protein
MKEGESAMPADGEEVPLGSKQKPCSCWKSTKACIKPVYNFFAALLHTLWTFVIPDPTILSFIVKANPGR